jgi:hypothetical protein
MQQGEMPIVMQLSSNSEGRQMVFLARGTRLLCHEASDATSGRLMINPCPRFAWL